MEKKFLQKETRKLKNLNHHLDDRLREQEKRLGAVTVELSKTWNLVGRMQRQHRQLHTHEQVLRYQLQQKRRMLTELKDELAYCRRKWDLAREKNDESQSQWDTLRKEFVKRKEQDSNASAESGYSDGPLSDDDTMNVNDARKRGNQCENAETAQYATELFELENNVAEAEMPGTENSRQVDDEQHMEATASSIVASNVVEQAQISRASVCHSRPGPSAASTSTVSSKGMKKLGKCGDAKTKLCFEKRVKKLNKTKSADDAGQKEESLHEMFCRISGQPMDRESSSEREADVDEDDDDDDDVVDIDDDDDEDDIVVFDDVGEENGIIIAPEMSQALAAQLAAIDERRILRSARIQRLEEQCKQLISQVTRASTRGDILNRQIDEVQKRYTPVREIPGASRSQTVAAVAATADDQLPSTSTSENAENGSNAASHRAERLKRLENECQEFLAKVGKTSARATHIDSKLNHLHEKYGRSSQDSIASEPVDKPSEVSNQPSTSTADDTANLTQREIDYTTKRAVRLQRLEQECAAFMSRVASTQTRASSIDSKLNDLHERYGRSSVENSLAETKNDETTTSNGTESIENDDENVIHEVIEESSAQTPTETQNDSDHDQLPMTEDDPHQQ